jgi:glycerophosphoryl diester phosphodiesterase
MSSNGMKIIGHRGAAGLELENTLASLRRAKELGVDGIEFDVRLTKDRQLVLCHDKDLARVSGNPARVANLTLKEIKKIKLYNGEKVPTLDEALDFLNGTWAIIEAKVGNCLDELLAVLDRHPKARVTIASFDHAFAMELEKRRPDISVYLAEKTRMTEIIHIVRQARADGIDLNAWLLNPLTYWLARRHQLEIMVFTINHPLVAKFVHTLYPQAAICTDFPDRLLQQVTPKKPQIEHRPDADNRGNQPLNG